MTIRDFLAQEGRSAVGADFYDYISLWASWYRGDVADFHHYSVYNGRNRIPRTRDGLNMAKRVCEDWANLLLNERVKITLGGDADARHEQKFFDAVAQENNLFTRLNEMQERKAATGTVAYIPYAAGVMVDGQTGSPMGGGTVKITCAAADGIFPLSWEDGEIRECAFLSWHAYNKPGQNEIQKYVHIQRHVLENGLYVVYNDLFEDAHGNITQVSLESVPAFAGVAARVETSSAERPFVIDRLAIANNLAPDCPMGIPVYANSIGVLRGIDLIYDSYNNEFVLGKKRIMVTAEALRESLDGKPVYDPNDVVFHILPPQMDDQQFIKEIDMELRADAHETALQNRLNLLSAQCGFGQERYKFDRGSVATATQVISENSDMYRTLKKHETLLETALKELVRVILRLGRDVLRLPLNPEVEITIDFDDSVIEDKQAEFTRDWQLLAGGIMRPEEFRAKWMHEDLETAKANLPGSDALMEEGIE